MRSDPADLLSVSRVDCGTVGDPVVQPRLSSPQFCEERNRRHQDASSRDEEEKNHS